MRYKITHTTTYAYSEAVPVCYNEVHLAPRDHARQTCAHNRLSVKPAPASVDRRIDYFGNHVTFFALHEAHHKLSVTALSKVNVHESPRPDLSVSLPWEEVRKALAHDRRGALLEACQYAFDSPHVKASAELEAYAAASFPPGRPLAAAALELTERIYADFVYDRTATTISTPLSEVLQIRRGVCQDFAHLEIGCLRSLGLAARYVSGYLLTTPPPGQPRLVGADASHAWLAVFCPRLGWIDLDPTNNTIPSIRHITLAWGRDYSDVCPISGVFVGGGKHGMSVSVDVSPLG